jgi:uncharacterized protein
MKKKIVLAGGTGFVGKYLKEKYIALGYEVIIISRGEKNTNWNNRSAIIGALENATMLINLAGKSVDCRYNEKNKKEIYDSRIDTTVALGEAILKCKNPPPLWINSSTATIYRHAEDKAMIEATGEIGTGFSVSIATAWEKAFFNFSLHKTRQVALRMAIVLGKDGGVVRPLKNLVRFGLGGKQGKGSQMFSWIHIEDVYRIIEFVQTNKYITGVINTSAPNPVTNKVLMQVFRKKMHKAFGLPAPTWLLKIGAILIKTETELILKSRWVIPQKLMDWGFVFTFKTVDDALKDILQTRKKN